MRILGAISAGDMAGVSLVPRPLHKVSGLEQN